MEMSRSKLPVTHSLSRPQPRDAAQVERSKEASRALGCDEDEAAFDEKMKRIAGHKPRAAPIVRSKPGKVQPSS